METTNLQLTTEQRQALLSHPGQPVHIADEQTQKVYVLIEQGALPALEEQYIRAGLQLARDQIARGEVSNSPIEDVIAKAKQREASDS